MVYEAGVQPAPALSRDEKERLLQNANLPGGRIRVSDVIYLRENTYEPQARQEVKEALNRIEDSRVAQQVLKDVLGNPEIRNMVALTNPENPFGVSRTSYNPNLNELRLLPDEKRYYFSLSPDCNQIIRTEFSKESNLVHELDHASRINNPNYKTSGDPELVMACIEKHAIDRENAWRKESAQSEPLRDFYNFGLLEVLYDEYKQQTVNVQWRRVYSNHPERSYNEIKKALTDNSGCGDPLSEAETNLRAKSGTVLLKKLISENRPATEQELIEYFNLLRVNN